MPIAVAYLHRMDIHYEWQLLASSSPLPDHLITLITSILSDQTPEEVVADLAYQQARNPLLVGRAFDGIKPVGFKIGYERQPGHFYSWLGGVSADYQRQGIASSLMEQQHDWCRSNGYHTVRTQTYNRWRSMLILNLRHGFNIVGTVEGKRGLMIILEKSLGTN